MFTGNYPISVKRVNILLLRVINSKVKHIGFRCHNAILHYYIEEEDHIFCIETLVPTILIRTNIFEIIENQTFVRDI